VNVITAIDVVSVMERMIIEDREKEVEVMRTTETTTEDKADADSTTIDVEEFALTTKKEIVPMEIAADFPMNLKVQEAGAVVVKENIVLTVVIIVILIIADVVVVVETDKEESASNSKKMVIVAMVRDVDSLMVKMTTEDNKETEVFASNSKKMVNVLTVKDADFLTMSKRKRNKKNKNKVEVIRKNNRKRLYLKMMNDLNDLNDCDFHFLHPNNIKH
jgi:hypothetical protein